MVALVALLLLSQCVSNTAGETRQRHCDDHSQLPVSVHHRTAHLVSAMWQHVPWASADSNSAVARHSSHNSTARTRHLPATIVSAQVADAAWQMLQATGCPPHTAAAAATPTRHRQQLKHTVVHQGPELLTLTAHASALVCGHNSWPVAAQRPFGARSNTGEQVVTLPHDLCRIIAAGDASRATQVDVVVAGRQRRGGVPAAAGTMVEISVVASTMSGNGSGHSSSPSNSSSSSSSRWVPAVKGLSEPILFALPATPSTGAVQAGSKQHGAGGAAAGVGSCAWWDEAAGRWSMQGVITMG